MLKARPAILLACCVALSACADAATKPKGTAPGARPALDVAAAQAHSGLLNLATREAGALSATVGALQVTTPTGGEAAGLADVSATVSGSDFAERYVFHAETRGAFPGAEGTLSGTITATTGTTTVVTMIEANLDCLEILGQPAGTSEPAGNNAFLSGPVTKYIRDGQPIDPNGLQVYFRVLAVDNGNQDNARNSDDGSDLASLLYAAPEGGCRSLSPVPVTPKAKVVVQPAAP